MKIGEWVLRENAQINPGCRHDSTHSYKVTGTVESLKVSGTMFFNFVVSSLREPNKLTPST